MGNKKIGTTILIIGLLLFSVLLGYNYQLNKASNLNGCNPNAQCMKVSSLLSLTNIFIGIIFSLISLGFYLIFFTKSEENLIKKIEEKNKQLTKEDKFDIMLKALTKEEQEAMKLIRQEEGITQAMLRIKTDMSKTKLSFVLSDLEKKDLIKKELFGKTNKVYLKQAF